MAQDWDIKPRGEACTKCSIPFADGQIYFSELSLNGADYVRSDVCEICKAANAEENPPISSWRAVFKAPPPPEEEALKKETAETLLRKLMDKEDSAHLNVIFVLAVMLERKRILIERDIRTEDDGAMIRVYEHRPTGDTFLIREPHLRLDQLEHVQEEVVVMLGGSKKKEGEHTDEQSAHLDHVDQAD